MLALLGRVLTMDPSLPEAEGVAVRDGRIEAVGRADEVRAAAGEGAEVVELGDELVLPAFIDAHHHYCMAAFDRGKPDLHDLESLDAVLARVERVASAAGDGWVRLQGYDPAKIREGRPPSADELDEVCRDRPVLLIAYSFHDACLNTRGLAEMGWDASSPDPPHGLLVRRNGRLTGEVSEGAMFLAEARSRESLVGQAEDAWIAECEAHGRDLLAAGIVRVGDAAVPPHFERLYERAAEAGSLPVIVHRMPVSAASMIHPRTDASPTGSGPAAAPIGPAKLFMDGAERCAVCFSMSQMARASLNVLRTAVGGEGLAALRAAGRIEWHVHDGHMRAGIAFWEQDALNAAVRAAAASGLQVAQHAIGNAAIELACGAFEAAGSALDGLPGRPRLEHVTFTDPPLARRVADTGAIAVVQPHFVYDMVGDFGELSPVPKPMTIMPMRMLIDAGIELAGSSDHPVSDYDVLAAVEAAVRRHTKGGRVSEPQEAITAEEALRAYTMGSAKALGVDHEAGSLTPGKRADIVVLSGDPRRTMPTSLEVRRTYVGGELAYEAAARAAAGSA